MVDDINTQHSWRQVTSTTRVKKLRRRPDYNRDKNADKNRRRDNRQKKKSSGQMPKAPDPDGKKVADDNDTSVADSGNKKSDARTNGHKRPGSIIDVVV